jgi:hypothetical protein
MKEKIHLGIKTKENIMGTVLYNVSNHDKFLSTLKEFINENGRDELIEEIMRGQYEGGIYSFDWEGGITMLESGKRHSMGSEHCLNKDTFGIGADVIYTVDDEEVFVTKNETIHVEED